MFLPVAAYTGRLHPKRQPLSGLRYIKEYGCLQVEVYKRVWSLQLQVYKRVGSLKVEVKGWGVYKLRGGEFTS